MDLRDYALLLRKRWRLIVLCTLLAVAASLAATLATTPTYQASAQLVVSTATGAEGDAGGLSAGGQFAQQRVKSYADIVNSPSVTEAVVDELGLERSATALAICCAVAGSSSVTSTVIRTVSSGAVASIDAASERPERSRPSSFTTASVTDGLLTMSA